MATFTVTTPVNIDTLASKVGSDVYNINGGYLTVDQDTRYGTNANTSASMGNITLSATLGGTIEFNATAVRLIPYNSGTGNVPAYNTSITQGGVSGKMIGVYSALNVAPTAPAAAMPASGYIKVKQVSGGVYGSGALTGIGASATGADTVGWIDIVGVDALTCTVNRLNTFKVRGDWFVLGTTTGANSGTYQIPSNGGIIYAAGVWVETAASSGVYEFYPCMGSNYAHVDSVATDAIRGKVCWISTAGLVRFQNDGTYSTGGYLPVSGLNIRIPNIIFNCCTAASPTVNVLPNATLATRYDFTTTGGGVIDIDKALMNWYPSFTQPFSVTLSDFGVLTQLNVSEIASPITWSNIGVGQEASNPQFGLVAATCFAGGTITDCTWTRATAAAAGYAVSLTDMSGFTFTNDKSIVLATRGNASTGAITLTRVNDSTWESPTLGGGRVAITTCINLTFNNTIYYDHIAWNTNFTAGPSLAATAWTRVTTTASITLANHGLKVGDAFTVSATSDAAAITNAAKTVLGITNNNVFTVTCLNAGGASGTLTYTRNAAPTAMNMFDLASSCDNIIIDGITFGGLYYKQPFNAMLNVGAAGCKNIKLRNLGTYASPLSLGSPRVDDQAWSRTTTTATVTSTAHGLGVGETIYVVVSSDVAAIVVGAKTVVAVPSANTFTFACLNAGAASGTICFFGTKAANVFTLANGAAANSVKIQRVYAPHTRTNLFTADNSSKNITLENVFSDYLNVPVFAYINGYTKNVGGTPTLAAQTSVYGTHWMNGYICDVADNQNAQSWSRSGTTVTVTSAGHSLRTGLSIVVNSSSAPTGATLGTKVVTVLSSNTFTYVGVNAGATSGTLDYGVLNGRIAIMMNEATTDTASQYSIDSGSPAFTSAGGLVMATVGDQVTFTSPDYIIGQGTTFPIAEIVMGGGTLTNYDVTYALDKNDGGSFSSFKNLSYPRTGASGSAAASTFTVTDATGVAVDDYVWGTGIGFNAKVTNIASNTITVDTPNIATVSGIVRFSYLANETSLGPDTGIKLKIRIKTSTASATAITSLYVNTNSTVVGRAYQYPLDTNTVTFTGLPVGTDVVVLTAGTSTILSQFNQIVSSSYVYSYSGAQTVDVGFIKPGYKVNYIRSLSLTTTDSSIPVQMTLDKDYQV